MVKFYVLRIQQGNMDLDDVPDKWRAAVAEELAK